MKFDDKGICNYCRGDNFPEYIKKALERKIALRKDFEKTIKSSRGEIYDCLVGVSGGKDSLYLLYLAKEKYNLRCLAFTVDNGLLSKYAKENIRMATDRLGIDHVTIKPSPSFYKKFYKKLIETSNNGYMNNVCAACSELFHSFALRLAIENDIPLILFGYSPDQITKYFYEIPEEELRKKKRIPKIMYSDDFTDEERMLFWAPTRKEVERIPRILFPYHVIPYPGVEEIERILKKKGLIRVSSPLYTNCSLSWLTLYLDIKKNHFNPLELNYSRLVREGKANRWKWLIIFSVGNMLLRSGLIKRKEIDKSLGFLGLKLKEI